MFTKILIVLALALIVLIGVIMTQPDQFRVERSATMAAPSSAVFSQINDLHNWKAWSPWAKRDPQMKETHEGSASGNGAIYSWVGNKEVGEGRMTIIESRPDELVKIKLEFFKPFAGTNTADFTFKGEGDKTVVNWSMYGPSNFMSKAIGLFMNMDKMIGGDFEKGLADMKAIVEAAPKP